MKYLIDGYNVTRRDPATRSLSLEKQRQALEARLRIHGQELLGTADYVIVWDGAGGSARNASKGSKADFTRLDTADDSIVGRVARSPEAVTVVTSDNELANRVRSVAQKGIAVMSSDALFASATTKKGASKKKPRMSRDVGIPSFANEINRELKEIWGID